MPLPDRRILTTFSRSRTTLWVVVLLGLCFTDSSKSWFPLGSIGLTASCLAPQDLKQELGSTGRAFRAESAGTSSPSVTITDHKITGIEPPGNCDTPTAKSSFRPTDARVYQWTLISGAVNGDVVRWDFRQPNGQTYFLTDPVTITFNGGVCLWAYINLAGFPPASMLGTWEVRVLYNNTVVATDSFTIRTDTVVLTDHRITGTAPTTCTPPPSKTTFAPTDTSVYQFTRVSGAVIGDQVKWEFVQPNGSIYASSSVLTISGDGDRCFWVSIDIAGQPAASLLGTWQVRVIYNNVLLLPAPDTFTIAQATCPAVNGINPVTGVPGSTATITGSNFTGVTAVKFSGGINANFNVVNATTITTVVPNDAVTGPLTLSKASCTDVLTPSFTVITDPVIEVTPSSLDFGSVVVGSAVTRQVTLRNLGGKALLFTSISSSQPSQFAIQSATSGFGLAIGGSLTVNVNFAPSSAGVTTANLLVASNDPTQPVVSRPMTGTGLAPLIDAIPTPLAFGDVRAAQSKDLVLSIRNNGTSQLNVTDVGSNNPLFAAIQFTEKPSNTIRNLPLNIAAGGLVEATIRFRPAFNANSIGNQNGRLSISSNDPSRPVVDVQMTGRGLGPAISAPPSLTLGSVVICTSTPITAGLTLVNTGNDPLSIVGLATNNPAFLIVQRPTLPVVLAPNANLPLTIGFSTRAIGTQNANLLVSSNAVNNPSLSVSLSAAGAALTVPSIGPIVASRTTLSHGRVDNARPASVFNPFGLVDVIGFVFPGGALPLNSIAPGLVPPPLIGGFAGLPPAAIPSAPDPFRITLSGGVANPVVAAAANIPSSFTLFVAEGIVAPALTKWERVGSRFGSGNLYATVAIPGTSILPGTELVTEADLNAYTANSIIYEAPDFGLVVSPAGQNGGTASIQARARTIPADAQCAPVTSQAQSADVEFSRTVRIEILPEQTVITRVGGGLDLSVTAQISGNFDPALNTVVRWGFDGNSVDIVVDMPDTTPPGAPRLLTQTFHLPIDEECKLAKVTAVASSIGNLPAIFLPAINPFLVIAPSTNGLFTFRSGGTTVEDTKSVLLKLPDNDCAGGGPVTWIHGVVSDAITGAPIEGASVSVPGGNITAITDSVVGSNVTAITDSNGSYVLNKVQPGSVTISVSSDGFNPKQVEVSGPPGQVVRQDISTLPMTGGVSGMVIDTITSLPVSAATVSVKGSNITAVTESDGRYVLSVVPLGPQTLTASKSGFTSYEGVVYVIGNLVVGCDFFLTPTLGRITGIVRNATTNQPIAGATISASGVSATTDGEGSYTLIDVPAGAQSISATAAGYNPGSSSATVISGGTVTSNIALQQLLGSVSGFVRNDDTNDPISGATVSISGTQLSTASGGDGSYIINNVPVLARTILAAAPNFVSSQRSVTVVGNATVPQDINLSPTKASIVGRVTSSTTGAGVSGVEVELLPFPLSFDTTKALGEYELKDVNTGPQVIFATKEGYYPKILSVNVAANQTSNGDLTITPIVGSVTGVVRDEYSRPISTAYVAALGTLSGASTGADGTFTLTDIPVGTQTLQASAGDAYSTVQIGREIKKGETIHQSFVLSSRAGSISGRVTDASTGAGIEGASIISPVPAPLLISGAISLPGGFYTLSRLPAGARVVYAGASGYVNASGSATVTDGGTATLDFALTREITTGRVFGIVKEAMTGNPIPDVTITISDHPTTTTTSSDGRYEILSVAPGSHVVSASKQGYQSAQLQVTVVLRESVMADFSLTATAQALGTVTGTVRNAQNADPIVGASITLSGTNSATTSGAGGIYTLSGVPQGNYTLVASANGFINSQVPITVTSGQSLTQNISLSPTLPAGEIRITLNWTKDGEGQPRDLDAHLVGPNPDGSCFHVYYSNKGNLDAAPFARLEVDNISLTGAPPIETVRISKLSPGIYRFYVFNYANGAENGIALSRATVQIFGASGSLGSFTVGSGSGRNWTVFEINGTTGAVRTINQLVAPSSSCSAPQ